ncbi:MAG TPA: DUF192 domain-containing protein [Thermomicrobiales bacterium]|nr:DUF192 domain-containing protein [Thermomicrobiales bacterium]
MARTQQVIVNTTNGTRLAEPAEDAVGLWGSFKGLMLKPEIPDRYGLVFRPAMGIHTCFMRFPIDLIYFDKENRVTKIKAAVKPWRVDLTSAAGVIEMNPGSAEAAGLRPGDVLDFQSA